MATMRGWVYRSRGTPQKVLNLIDDLPRPTSATLGPLEVLLETRYAGLFQGTAAVRTMMPHFNNKPWLAETTFSGIVIT